MVSCDCEQWARQREHGSLDHSALRGDHKFILVMAGLDGEEHYLWLLAGLEVEEHDMWFLAGLDGQVNYLTYFNIFYGRNAPQGKNFKIGVF